MQLDLLDLLHEEELITEQSAKLANQKEEVEQYIASFDKTSYESVKANTLTLTSDQLPWKTSYDKYECCDLEVIIPPYILSATEDWEHNKSKRWDDPVTIAMREKWAAYTTWIWKFSGTTWEGASRKLTEHRDKGIPIWIRLTRIGGKLLDAEHYPDCILRVGS